MITYQVNKDQYLKIRKSFGGFIFHRKKENEKKVMEYFVKAWNKGVKQSISKIIEN